MSLSSTFYKTFTKEELDKRTIPSSLILDERYKLEWKNDSSFTIICEDTSSKDVFTRHMNTVTGILKLNSKGNHGKFLSIGLDNTIQISQNNGMHVSSLDRHDDRIIGVKELHNGMIVAVTEHGKITIWDIKKSKLVSVIDSKTEDLDNINFLTRESAIFIRSSKDAAIWTYDGEQIVTLTGINANLDKAYRLSSNNWLIWIENGNPSLWSSEGVLLTKFKFNFDPTTGYVELESTELLINIGPNIIALFNPQGELIEQHSHDPEIEKLFFTLSRNIRLTHKEIENKPSIDYYDHFRNSFTKQHNMFIPEDELKKQDLSFEKDSSERKVWDFFIRPDTWGLRTTLKDKARVANDSIDIIQKKNIEIEDRLKKHKLKTSIYRVASWMFIIMTLSALSIGIFAFLNTEIMIEMTEKKQDLINLINQHSEVFAFSPGGLIGIFWLVIVNFLNKEKKAVKIAESDIALQNALRDGNQKIIIKIKEYRRRLVNQIPVVQQGNENLYEGEFIRSHISDLLNEKLKDLAMEQCGIETEDIVLNNNEPIILPSWSLIQDYEKRKLLQNKLILENEYSIRGIKDGTMISAVQYIQYIFLTKDKIDVFTMYYDFITNKSVGKEANAFFYKDVTNITKREVDRKEWLGDNENNDIAATEIVLSVASGEQICLTILNQESVSNIDKQRKENETISPEMEIKNLESKISELSGKDNLTEDEEDDLEQNKTLLINAKAGSHNIIIPTVDNKAEAAITNIRSFLKQHKKETV
jgi:hypothetical protein